MWRGDPRRSFRRGLFLGLTTAEIAILLVFVLLLLFTTADQAEETLATSDLSPAELRHRLDEVTRDFQAARDALDEMADWRELARQEAARADELARRFTALEEVAETQRAELDDLRRALTDRDEEIARLRDASGDVAAALGDELDDTRAELDGTRAELRRVRARLQDAERRLTDTGTGPGGTGSDHPSCWHDLDGNIEYLWDIALHARGFLLRPGPSPHNDSRRTDLPITGTTTGAYLSEGDFREQTRPVFAWSVRENCRFFVRAYDDTPADAKNLYKARMTVLEGHFYKNASPSGRAPRP